MKILVIAAHPDDEVLGCGGTLYKLSKNKENKIFIAFAANGVGGRGKNEDIDLRQKELLKVSKYLGGQILNQEDDQYYRFEDQQLDQSNFNDVVGWIKGLIDSKKPEVIYTHYYGDLNRDHQIVAEAVLVATRPNKYGFIKRIYSFEINMGSINQGQALNNNQMFAPNVFEKIDLHKKMKLFDKYKSEHKYWPNWQEDLETVAKFRGFSSNYNYAEAFMLFRERND